MKPHPLLALALVLWGAVSWLPTLGFVSLVWPYVPLVIAWGIIYARRRMTAELALWQWVSIVACGYLALVLNPATLEQFEVVLLVVPVFAGTIWFALWMLPFGIANSWAGQNRRE